MGRKGGTLEVTVARGGCSGHSAAQGGGEQKRPRWRERYGEAGLSREDGGREKFGWTMSVWMGRMTAALESLPQREWSRDRYLIFACGC
jgi:hypothetical protein